MYLPQGSSGCLVVGHSSRMSQRSGSALLHSRGCERVRHRAAHARSGREAIAAAPAARMIPSGAEE